MNWPRISLGFLYVLAVVLIVRNLYALFEFSDVFTDPNVHLQLKILLFAQSLFWVILGVLLFVATYKRSRFVVGITLAAVLYLVISFLIMFAPLAKFYFLQTSGVAGLKILATIAATNLVQIILAFATYLIARRLRTLGHVT